MSTETSLVSVRAAVYKHNPSSHSWAGVDSGLSRVDVFHNPAQGTYRVIGMDSRSKQFTMNTMIFPQLQYQRATEIFHQWTDSQRDSWGLNFASVEEAERFSNSVASCITELEMAIRTSSRPPAMSPPSTPSAVRTAAVPQRDTIVNSPSSANLTQPSPTPITAGNSGVNPSGNLSIAPSGLTGSNAPRGGPPGNRPPGVPTPYAQRGPATRPIQGNSEPVNRTVGSVVTRDSSEEDNELQKKLAIRQEKSGPPIASNPSGGARFGQNAESEITGNSDDAARSNSQEKSGTNEFKGSNKRGSSGNPKHQIERKYATPTESQQVLSSSYPAQLSPVQPQPQVPSPVQPQPQILSPVLQPPIYQPQQPQSPEESRIPISVDSIAMDTSSLPSTPATTSNTLSSSQTAAVTSVKPVTKEDLEELKREIFAYIDQTKNEIIAQLVNQLNKGNING